MLGIFSRTLCNCQIVTIRYCVTAEGNAIYFRDDSAEGVLLVCCRRWSWNWMNSGRRKEKVNRSEKYAPLYPYKTGRFQPSIRLSGDERYNQEKVCLDAIKKSCALMQSRKVVLGCNLSAWDAIKKVSKLKRFRIQGGVQLLFPLDRCVV